MTATSNAITLKKELEEILPAKLGSIFQEYGLGLDELFFRQIHIHK